MTNAGIVLVAGAALAVMMHAAAYAFPRADRGNAAGGPAITLIASKKSPARVVTAPRQTPYERAWELCRRKYGLSNVVRVRFLSNGKIICYVRFYSPNQ